MGAMVIMLVYTVNLFIVYGWSLLARFYSQREDNSLVKSKPSWLLSLIPLSSLILVSGLRYGVGTDYWRYVSIYQRASHTDLGTLMSGKDPGFTLLCWVLGNISANPQLIFLVTSTITNVLIVSTLRDFANPFEMGMFLYIGTYAYYGSFNATRQYIAAAIGFWAFRYLVQGKFIRYTLAVLVASTFHLSALLLIPVYFFVRTEAWSKTTWLLIISCIVTFVFFEEVVMCIFNVIQIPQYDHYRKILLDPASRGANPLRFCASAVPVIFAHVKQDSIRKRFRGADILMNMCILNAFFTLLSLRHVYMARMAIYFELYLVLLLSHFTRVGNSRLANCSIYVALLISYLVYSYCQLPYVDGVLPYDFVF